MLHRCCTGGCNAGQPNSSKSDALDDRLFMGMHRAVVVRLLTTNCLWGCTSPLFLLTLTQNPPKYVPVGQLEPPVHDPGLYEADEDKIVPRTGPLSAKHV